MIKKFLFEIKLGCSLLVGLICILVVIYFFSPSIKDMPYFENNNIGELLSFSDIRKEVSTGDLILLNGNTYGEKMIRFGTSSPWNHVGMIVTKPGNRNEVWLWEADMGQGFDSGVRLVPLGLKLMRWRHSKYKIGAWMKLKTNKNMTYTNLSKFIESEKGKKLETSYYPFLLSMFGSESSKNHGVISDTYYCSELVAKTYQYAGICPKDINTIVSPNDFFTKSVKMTQGNTLEDAVLFKF